MDFFLKCSTPFYNQPKAYKLSNKTIAKDSYIQVLNLMYVCDKVLSQAIQKVEEYPTIITCDTEKKNFLSCGMFGAGTIRR